MDKLIKAIQRRDNAVRLLNWSLKELREKCHEDGQIAENMRDVWKNQNGGNE